MPGHDHQIMTTITTMPGITTVPVDTNTTRRLPVLTGRSLTGHRRAAHFALRVFAPSTLGRPPKELASEQNDGCQYQPSVNSGGDDARTKRNYWRAHCEIIRAGVAAVSAAAPPCVENARRSHPA